MTTTIRSPLERTEYFIELWRKILPTTIAPAIADAAWWLRYDDEVVEHAIILAARRFTHRVGETDFYVSKVFRYVTATCRTMKTEQEQHAA